MRSYALLTAWLSGQPCQAWALQRRSLYGLPSHKLTASTPQWRLRERQMEMLAGGDRRVREGGLSSSQPQRSCMIASSLRPRGVGV